MKRILQFHLVLTFIGAISAQLISNPFSVFSFFVGSMLILLNLGVIYLSWDLIIQKKLIARATVIIVIKYLILGLMVFALIRYKWVDPLWFGLGLGTLLFSVMGWFTRTKG